MQAVSSIPDTRADAHTECPALGMAFLRGGRDHVILARSDAPLKRDPKDSRRAHHAFKVDSDKYEGAKAFLTAKRVEVFEESHQ
jgi:hypothetical protein